MSLLDKVEKHARKEFRKAVWKSFPYHNLAHTESVVALCTEIAEAMELDDDQIEILIIAAWFHDLGYSDSYAHHEEASKEMAEAYLNNHGCKKGAIQTILDVIESTRVDYARHKSTLEQIMFDADRSSIGHPNFFIFGNLLRKEWEEHDFALFSDEGWNALQVRYLENTQFKTSFSQQKFGHQRLINLDLAKKRLP